MAIFQDGKYLKNDLMQLVWVGMCFSFIIILFHILVDLTMLYYIVLFYLTLDYITQYRIARHYIIP